MGDDTTVSFVFGLEVNWTLLQARQTERAETDELHKIQMKKDIMELNERRRRIKSGERSPNNSSPNSVIGSSSDEEGSDEDENEDGEHLTDGECEASFGEENEDDCKILTTAKATEGVSDVSKSAYGTTGKNYIYLLKVLDFAVI